MAGSVRAIKEPPLLTHNAWEALALHYKKVSQLHLRQLFTDDPERGKRMTVGCRTTATEILVNMGGVVVDDDYHPAGLGRFFF